MGDKDAGPRSIAKQAGVPVVPGQRGPARGRPPRRSSSPTEIGYPVMIKAAAGGGGRGMRVVRERGELAAGVRAVRRPRPERRSATPTSTSRSSSSSRATSRCRCSATARQRASTCASATARSSAATRSSSRNRPRPLCRRDARTACASRARGAPRAVGLRQRRAPSSSSSTRDGQLLLHRDEHPHPGRAPGDRDGHRHRPGPRADPHRRRRAARLPAGRRRASRGHAIECRINAEDPGDLRAERRAASPPGCRRAASACAWTPTDGAGYAVPPFYDSLLAKIIVHEARPATRRSHGCAERSAKRCWRASRPPSRSI